MVGVFVIFFTVIFLSRFETPFKEQLHKPTVSSIVSGILGIISGLWFFRLLLKDKIKLLP
jgi:multisubunit Na+/H+ antiporter MnhG subunit